MEKENFLSANFLQKRQNTIETWLCLSSRLHTLEEKVAPAKKAEKN